MVLRKISQTRNSRNTQRFELARTRTCTSSLITAPTASYLHNGRQNLLVHMCATSTNPARVNIRSRFLDQQCETNWWLCCDEMNGHGWLLHSLCDLESCVILNICAPLPPPSPGRSNPKITQIRSLRPCV